MVKLNRLIIIFSWVYFYFIPIGNFKGQNLVPNGGFEKLRTCPRALSEIRYAGWFNAINRTYDSPDFYHVCCKNPIECGVPGLGGIMFQYPFEGEGYAGISVYSKDLFIHPTDPEFLQTKLKKPLNKGITYEIKFHVNLSNGSRYAIEDIGAYLSETQLKFGSHQGLYRAQIDPQIKNSAGIIKDTLNWVEISGLYEANGGEVFLTIGCFKRSRKLNLEGGLSRGNAAYYYVDGVSVVEAGVDAEEPHVEPQAGLKPDAIIEEEITESLRSDGIYRLQYVTFAQNKAELFKASTNELVFVAEFLKNNDSIKVEVAGHTDDVGSEEYNKELSKQRAESVADFLVEQGVEATRLLIAGYGKTMPLLPNEDEESRAQNRRVEIRVVN